MDQREGVELQALAMLFGATSDPALHCKQERLQLLSEETVAYDGQAEVIEQEVARRKVVSSARKEDSYNKPLQPRLLKR